MGRKLLAVVIGYVALALLTRWFSPEQLTPADADMPFELARLGVDERTLKSVTARRDSGGRPATRATGPPSMNDDRTV